MNGYWAKNFSSLRSKKDENNFSSKIFSSDLTKFIKWGPAPIIKKKLDSKIIVETAIFQPFNSVEVIFLSDYVRDKNAIEIEQLISKIALAMKLEENNFRLIHFIDGKLDKRDELSKLFENNFSNLKKIIIELNPKVIVTLGAAVTNFLLQQNQRLISVHGKFFDLLLEENRSKFETKIVPIFHPEYLMVNPSMKKTVWDDLQKIMKFIGKN